MLSRAAKIILFGPETHLCAHIHLELAVGDGSDSSFDSAIFLEAASFRSVPSLTTQLARLHESLRLNAWFDGQGQLVMETGEITIGAVRLLDLNGRLVHQMLTNGSGRIEMPEPHVPAGVYLLEAESEGRVLRAKLVKE